MFFFTYFYSWPASPKFNRRVWHVEQVLLHVSCPLCCWFFRYDGKKTSECGGTGLADRAPQRFAPPSPSLGLADLGVVVQRWKQNVGASLVELRVPDVPDVPDGLV